MDSQRVLAEELQDEIEQLEAWANAAKRGGWSTQHVEPMRNRAEEIRGTLWKCGYGPGKECRG